LPAFRYIVPQTIEQAVTAFQEHKGQAVFFAGGTDLVPLMKSGAVTPGVVISLSDVPGLSFIREESDGIRVGARTTISTLRKSLLVREHCRALHESVQHFAAAQVRNMATLGGNIGRRSPCANTPPPLMALSSTLTLVGPTGPLAMPVEQYFDRPEDFGDCLITEVRIPCLSPNSASTFTELTRNSADLAKVNCAANISIQDGICIEARIFLGSVASRPIRVTSVEQLLIGQEISDAVIDRAAQKADEQIAPITDARSTSEYRRHVSPVLVTRAVKRAAQSVTNG
jgi:carbon-monoxide dehydrogenase medium subunit